MSQDTQEQTYIATQGERLDMIFVKIYGDLYQNSYESGYNAFILANIDLIHTPILSGGEVVKCPIFSDNTESSEELGLWA
ncbi:hypothetical protein LS71_002790 [Helicobacter jaachi]|uniref:Phage tail protein n=1 Tax=Helicobacter jaachi TaxID=1677920 RepID=A0A4U8TDD9_9HELI|nr:hypothetical protein [Helicobacter jaachi]TLD97684.1 hypothetical protein LS71_002790 [Helicobacter jaachi]